MKVGIKEGDVVDVCFSSEDSFLTDCKVLYTPCAVGDLWKFEREGLIYAINSGSSEFLMLVKKGEKI